jgi:uncharacterized membrane protein
MMCVKKILISAIIMLALDFIYITTNLQKFQDQIITVQRVVMQFKPLGAVICYILLIFGLYYFILRNKRPVYEAFFFGLVIYGVYDSTNYATLKKWSPSLAIMDALWGGVLMASTTYLTYLFV